MGRDARGYGSDGNSYALDCYLDETSLADDIYEAYQLALSDAVDPLAVIIKDKCEVLEATERLLKEYPTSELLTSILEDIKGDIYGTYEEMVTLANGLDHNDFFDSSDEVKEVLGKSLYDTVMECE